VISTELNQNTPKFFDHTFRCPLWVPPAAVTGSGEQLIKEREREVAPVTFGNDRKTGRLRHCT
jgi:hypothetical protein